MSTAAPDETGDLTWREQKKLLTRRALHDAARRLVLEKGVGAVTVEEICAEAGVSPRTFFNYFPTKAAAALGLPDLRIGEAQQRLFVEGTTGNVVHDLCAVLAAVLLESGDALSDKEAKHDLVAKRPELQPELHGWMAGLRRQVLDLAELRLPATEARAAAALVIAAFLDAVQMGEARRADLADRLWSTITTMCAVAGCRPPAA